MYELSDKTKEYLKNYDTPVDIYILAGESEQDGNIRTVLDKYATANKNINVTNINMTSNPTFGKKTLLTAKLCNQILSLLTAEISLKHIL